MKAISRAIVWAMIAAMGLFLVPSAAAQGGCAAFNIPPGLEWGDFITNVWYAQGDITIKGENFHVDVTIFPVTYWLNGQKGNNSQGKETALYDFGAAGSFRTNIIYVIQHNNDPSKWSMTAIEEIIPGSGTGRFAGVTGHFADQGAFWMTNWDTLEGEGLFVTHGNICGMS